jgi:hypothetical protein
VFPLVCASAGFLALRAGRPWWAGVALGSIAIKPQLGVAVAVVMVARREWRIVGGAMAGAAAQWGVAWLAWGTDPMLAYVRMLRMGPRLAALLEPKPEQLHSLAGFWTLLLGQSSAAQVLYGVSGVLAVGAAARVWRVDVPLEARYAALLLSTVLAAPHVGGYELVVIAPAFVLTAAWSECLEARRRRRFRALLYAAYVVPLAGPLAAVTHVQASVPVLATWLAALILDAPPAPSSVGARRC